MDDALSNWCTVCDRQIVPMRTVVTVPHDNLPRKQANRNGLVHGTGRAQQVKTRVEIDQSPAPLYCSDECRQRDVDYYHGSSIRIERKQTPRKSTPNTRSLALLHREAGMIALPAPTSETYDEHAPPQYTSGVMMANRRLEAVLPKPLKPGERPSPLKPVPGWTDGSQAWRASTYSFAPPPRTRADVLDPNRAAYESFVASPHRSASSGVVASSSSSYFSAPPSPTASSFTSGTSVDSDLLSSFEDTFSRRTSSRLSLYSSVAVLESRILLPSRKQRISQAAGSMLLVPEVLVRPPGRSSSFGFPSPSTTAFAAIGSPPLCWLREPAGPTQAVNPEPEDAEEAAFVRSCGVEALPPSRRPKTEMRSWSYDNVRTYPVMAMPTLKEVHLVDGKEVEVEVPRKPLFTFEPVEVRVSA
ncbi:hypothetical protein FB45DRAFT_897289 [Roridomyces roridus]|uniref:Uncharacterized protein n=1 Tax=Roridomyces roridus TaxID=1738132 RepID=A0AAD7CB38_9AGAR|nr:hypothetical protein FB45DRAFT_897289 [Roridomyces roridus]